MLKDSSNNLKVAVELSKLKERKKEKRRKEKKGKKLPPKQHMLTF